MPFVEQLFVAQSLSLCLEQRSCSAASLVRRKELEKKVRESQSMIVHLQCSQQSKQYNVRIIIIDALLAGQLELVISLHYNGTVTVGGLPVCARSQYVQIMNHYVPKVSCWKIRRNCDSSSLNYCVPDSSDKCHWISPIYSS